MLESEDKMKLVIKNLKTLWWVIIGLHDGTTRIERWFILRYLRHRPDGCHIDGDMIYFQRRYSKKYRQYTTFGIVTTGLNMPLKIRNPLLIHSIKKILKRFDTKAVSIYFNLSTRGIKVYVVDMQEELL